MASLRTSFARSLVVGAASLALLAGSALAQPGGGGGGGGGRGGPGGFGGFGGGMFMGGGGGGNPFDPRITSEQLTRYGGMLGLTDDQKEAAKGLYDGYFAAHQEQATKIRTVTESAREQFRETRDPSVWQEIGPKMQEFRTASDTAEKALLEDLKSLLNEEQMAKWPAMERTRRRETTIRRGFVSGERADVIRIVDELKLPEDQHATLTPVLESYEQDLDRELIKRNEIVDQAQNQGGNFMQAFRGGGDTTQIDKLITEGREAAVRVRDVNRRYAKQVEALLPEDKAGEFNLAFKRESFPQIYRQRYAQQVITAASGFEDLTQDQRDGLAAIKDTYSREATTLATKAEAATEQQEQNFSIQGMMQRGFQEDPAIVEARNARNKLEEETVAKIRALLNPEQVGKLPERRADGQGPGGGGGGNADRPQRGQRGANGAGGANGGENQRPPRRQRPGREGGGEPMNPPGA